MAENILLRIISRILQALILLYAAYDIIFRKVRIYSFDQTLRWYSLPLTALADASIVFTSSARELPERFADSPASPI